MHGSIMFHFLVRQVCSMCFKHTVRMLQAKMIDPWFQCVSFDAFPWTRIDSRLGLADVLLQRSPHTISGCNSFRVCRQRGLLEETIRNACIEFSPVDFRPPSSQTNTHNAASQHDSSVSCKC